MKLRKAQTARKSGGKLYKRGSLNSYYKGDSETQGRSPFTTKQPAGKTRKFMFGIADIALLVLLLFGLAYSLMLKPEPNVKANVLAYHPSAYYKQQITPLFKGIKNTNKFSFDEAPLTAAIKQQFPEVQSVHIELPFFSEKPVVWLDISKPAFKLTSQKNSYIVDAKGVAIAIKNTQAETKGLLAIQDQSGFKTKPGQQVLSSDAVNFIKTIVAQSQAAKVPIKSMVLPAKAQELDLYTTDANYYVKYYLGGDAMVQAGQFLAARHKFAESGPPPSQYLDVRVPGKIFYK